MNKTHEGAFAPLGGTNVAEPVSIPMAKRAVRLKAGIYLVVIAVIAAMLLRLEAWSDTAWIGVGAALLLVHFMVRMLRVAARGEVALALEDKGIRIFCWDRPLFVPWASLIGCDPWATHTIKRVDSLRLLLHEDRLPEGVSPSDTKVHPRVESARYIRIDGMYLVADCEELAKTIKGLIKQHTGQLEGQ